MKIVLTHSSDLSWKEEMYDALKGSSFGTQHEIFFPQEGGAVERITADVIRGSAMVLAEVSLPSTGEGIELGWANAFNVPVICFYKKGSHISKSLQYITDTFIEYSTMEDMIGKIAQQLNRF